MSVLWPRSVRSAAMRRYTLVLQRGVAHGKLRDGVYVGVAQVVTIAMDQDVASRDHLRC